MENLMKINNVFYLIAIFCVTGLMAMDGPLSLEQYKNVLATGDCGQIVTATQLLWPKGMIGFHVALNDDDEFCVKGGVNAGHADEYRAALHDFVVKNILKAAIQNAISIDKA